MLKNKLNSVDNLLLKKLLITYNLVVLVRSVFQENTKVNTVSSFKECLYELTR